MDIDRKEFIETVGKFINAMLVESGDSDDFNARSSLVESGRVASVNIIEIVSFLEETYDIDFSEVDFDLDNFETVETLAGSLDL